MDSTDENTLIVGQVAKARLRSHPMQTVAVFKRDMGSSRTYRLAQHTFTAPELSALVIQSLKQDAEIFLGQTVHEAVISVPAYFNDMQRKATIQAAEIAGLNVRRLINEPTAAAIAYGLHDAADGARYVILDLGGGTFDVSVVEYFSGVIEVHASAGDNFLGGEDFLEYFANAYANAHGISLQKLPLTSKQTLYTQLEHYKNTLSKEESVHIPSLLPEQTETWTVTRQDYGHWVKPLINRMMIPIERALQDARLNPDDIDRVILVGGASRMAHVRALASRLFKKIPLASLDPDLVVAMGAAIQAGLSEQDAALDDVVLTDV